MGRIITLEKYAAMQKRYDFMAWLVTKHHKNHKSNFLQFDTHQYLRKIYHDKSEYIVIIKSTQNGISEYLLVRALAHAIQGMRVFYVLPTYELVKRFVDERYEKSTQNTPYYRGLVRMAKEEMDNKMTESVKSKDIGDGNIAFVNSGSSAGFTEYAADEVIIDELDKCDQTNIKMADERLSHSDYRWRTKISNPTYRNFGIDAEYKNTDQLEWYVKCENGHSVNLDWFTHVVKEYDDGRYMIRDTEWSWESGRDIYPICDKCGAKINRHSDGEWVSHNESTKRGYRLTKLFSGTVTIAEILDRFNDGLSDDETMQRVYNADLGKAYTAEGSTITRDMITNRIEDYNYHVESGMIIAGIDVGKYYNYVIKKITHDGKLKTLKVGKERNTETLITILREYKIKAGIIDGLPETREARKIASKFPMMFLCYFGSAKKDSIDPRSKTVTVQRTSAIDAVKESLLTDKIVYPHNVGNDEEFISQMTSSVRVFNAEKKSGGQQGAYEWVEDGPDHYLLATAYCLIAQRLLILMKR